MTGKAIPLGRYREREESVCSQHLDFLSPLGQGLVFVLGVLLPFSSRWLVGSGYCVRYGEPPQPAENA